MLPPHDPWGGFKHGRFPLPPDEEHRMNVLRQLDILDSSAEASFDHITNWGRRTFKVPICVITLVDSNRQWFKSCYGLGVNQTGRDEAFCSHAIMPDAPDVFEIPDALADVRFAKNPLVIGAPHIRYYAGAPLLFEGHKMGTVCIIDTEPRAALDAEQRDTLICLASMVSDQLNSRLQSRKLQVMHGEMQRKIEEVNAVNAELKALIDTANAPIFAVDTEQRVTVWNRKIAEVHAHAAYAAYAALLPILVLLLMVSIRRLAAVLPILMLLRKGL